MVSRVIQRLIHSIKQRSKKIGSKKGLYFTFCPEMDAEYQVCPLGRDQTREASEISFHSLRHSAVTMLKAAGVSDFVAREIVGHESAAVSRQYTHLTTDDKRAAMQRLPDVTDN